jgi:hypothetical protein
MLFLGCVFQSLFLPPPSWRWSGETTQSNSYVFLCCTRSPPFSLSQTMGDVCLFLLSFPSSQMPCVSPQYQALSRQGNTVSGCFEFFICSASACFFVHWRCIGPPTYMHTGLPSPPSFPQHKLSDTQKELCSLSLSCSPFFYSVGVALALLISGVAVFSASGVVCVSEHQR